MEMGSSLPPADRRPPRGGLLVPPSFICWAQSRMSPSFSPATPVFSTFAAAGSEMRSRETRCGDGGAVADRTSEAGSFAGRSLRRTICAAYVHGDSWGNRRCLSGAVGGGYTTRPPRLTFPALSQNSFGTLIEGSFRICSWIETCWPECISRPLEKRKRIQTPVSRMYRPQHPKGKPPSYAPENKTMSICICSCVARQVLRYLPLESLNMRTAMNMVKNEITSLESICQDPWSPIYFARSPPLKPEETFIWALTPP